MAGPVSGVVLFDTDVLIDASRRVEDALSALERAEESHTPAVSAVTQMELIVGCRDKSELQALDRFLTRFHVLPLNEVISAGAVALLARYRLSHGLLIPDALIAATAFTQGIALISKNQRVYRYIEDLDLLPYPAPFASS